MLHERDRLLDAGQRDSPPLTGSVRSMVFLVTNPPCCKSDENKGGGFVDKSRFFFWPSARFVINKGGVVTRNTIDLFPLSLRIKHRGFQHRILRNRESDRNAIQNEQNLVQKSLVGLKGSLRDRIHNSNISWDQSSLLVPTDTDARFFLSCHPRSEATYGPKQHEGSANENWISSQITWRKPSKISYESWERGRESSPCQQPQFPRVQELLLLNSLPFFFKENRFLKMQEKLRRDSKSVSWRRNREHLNFNSRNHKQKSYKVSRKR